jgi:hypothetical protein
LVTRAIAYPGITFRRPDGERETVRTLFGCVRLVLGLI